MRGLRNGFSSAKTRQAKTKAEKAQAQICARLAEDLHGFFGVPDLHPWLKVFFSFDRYRCGRPCVRAHDAAPGGKQSAELTIDPELLGVQDQIGETEWLTCPTDPLRAGVLRTIRSAGVAEFSNQVIPSEGHPDVEVWRWTLRAR